MSLKIIEGRRAYNLAKRRLPIIIHGYEHRDYDWPSRIFLSDDRRRNQKRDTKPVIYYWVRMDKDFYYIGYALYHQQDYTKCVFAKLLGLGEHQHDFEGFVIRIPYYLPHHEDVSLKHDVITVSHNNLVVGALHKTIWPCDYIRVESRGHAIRPCSPIDHVYKANGSYIILNNPRLTSLDKMSIEAWHDIKTTFNRHGVNMPDQWSHNGEFEGWMWGCPDKLFKEMCE